MKKRGRASHQSRTVQPVRRTMGDHTHVEDDPLGPGPDRSYRLGRRSDELATWDSKLEAREPRNHAGAPSSNASARDTGRFSHRLQHAGTPVYPPVLRSVGPPATLRFMGWVYHLGGRNANTRRFTRGAPRGSIFGYLWVSPIPRGVDVTRYPPNRRYGGKQMQLIDEVGDILQERNFWEPMEKSIR